MSKLCSFSENVLLQLSSECRRKGKTRIRIRKEVNRLTQEEKSKLNNALKQAMLDNTDFDFNYPDLANYHGAPFTICTGRKKSLSYL